MPVNTPVRVVALTSAAETVPEADKVATLKVFDQAKEPTPETVKTEFVPPVAKFA